MAGSSDGECGPVPFSVAPLPLAPGTADKSAPSLASEARRRGAPFRPFLPSTRSSHLRGVMTRACWRKKRLRKRHVSRGAESQRMEPVPCAMRSEGERRLLEKGDLNLEVRYLYPNLKYSRTSGRSVLQSVIRCTSALSTGYSKLRLIVAGTPTASLAGGMSLVTTAPAPVMDPSPTVTGATSMVSHPMNASSSTTVRCLSLPS